MQQINEFLACLDECEAAPITVLLTVLVGAVIRYYEKKHVKRKAQNNDR